jgi:NitT/TauT family transport system substrate-binding protein
MRRRRFLAGSVTVAGLAVAHAVPSAAQAPMSIDAAGTLNDTAALLFYAADMGFYEKAGLHVNVTTLNNSGAISTAIASNAVQIGSFAISVGALARDHGVPLVLVAPAGLYLSTTPTSGLIVAQDAPYRKAADLNGKTIATRDLSNLSYFGARAWLDRNGGDSKSVRWLEVPDTSAVAAIKAGRVDAASISEPALDDALAPGDIRSLASVFDAIADRFLISGYYTTEDYAASHPEIVRTFARVIASTSAWANKNRAITAKILAKYVQAPVLPGSKRATYADELRAADVQPVLDVLLAYGFVKSALHAKDMFSPLVPSA